MRRRFTIAREAEVAMKSENKYAIKGGKRAVKTVVRAQ